MDAHRHTSFFKRLLFGGWLVTMVSCQHTALHRFEESPGRLVDSSPPPRASEANEWHSFGLNVGGAFIADFDTTVRVWPLQSNIDVISRR